MIRYALSCDAGHDFEGWFASSDDFDKQSERGLLTCPQCGSGNVGKALMAPSVSSGKKSRGSAPTHAPAEPARNDMALLDEQTRNMIGKIREIRKAILSNTEDVGTRFSEEARKIHYGEAEERGIRGQADAKEAASLIEEGIAVMPVPSLPDDKN